MRLKAFEKMLREGAEALVDPRGRNILNYCDYLPVHKDVKWRAILSNGHTFGQSCTRHAGALLIAAAKKDPAARIESIKRL